MKLVVSENGTSSSCFGFFCSLVFVLFWFGFLGLFVCLLLLFLFFWLFLKAGLQLLLRMLFFSPYNMLAFVPLDTCIEFIKTCACLL